MVEIGPVVGGNRGGRKIEETRAMRVHELPQARISGEFIFHLVRRRNSKYKSAGGIARRSNKYSRSLAEGLRQHFCQAASEPGLIDLELDEEDSVRRQQGARLPKRFFGVDEIVDAHVGVVGELGVGVEQSEEDEVVVRGGTLHEGAGVGEVDGDAGIVIGVLGMAAAEAEDGWIDLDGIHGAAAVAQGARYVIAGARSYDQYIRVCGGEAEREVVGILIGRFGQDAGMAIQKVAREVDDRLVSGVIDTNFGAGDFAVRERLLFDFNLLVRGPEIEMMRRRRIMQQKDDRHGGGD